MQRDDFDGDKIRHPLAGDYQAVVLGGTRTETSQILAHRIAAAAYGASVRAIVPYEGRRTSAETRASETWTPRRVVQAVRFILVRFPRAALDSSVECAWREQRETLAGRSNSRYSLFLISTS